MLVLLFCNAPKLQNMKNILIPTILDADTTGAVAAAIKHAASGCCTIVLILFSEAPDAYTATDYLSRISPQTALLNNITLKRCRTLVEGIAHCNLQVHHQYGISAPLLRNILEYKNIDLIILPESFKASREKICKYCTKLLLKSKCPILHTGAVAHRNRMSNALYLEDAGCVVTSGEVAQRVHSSFPYKVVSQACISHIVNPEDLRPLLAETIFKNDIDVLIATRNPMRKGNAKTSETGYDTILGLPVLSLYEI